MRNLKMSRFTGVVLGLAILAAGAAQAAVQGTSWRQPVPFSVQTTASARLDALFAAGCQPYKAKGVDYNGCAGDAPPPLDDKYQTAVSRGFKGSREQLIEACKTNANLCVVDPIPHDCPTGTVWSQAGGMPHCVRVDPTCNSGYQIAKDAFGNPSCQVVTAPCTPGPITVTGSCATYYGAGTWTGLVYYTRDVTCPGNIKGPKVYDSDTCVDSSVVTCPSDTTVAVACKAGTTGTAYKTTTYSGASCTATTLPIDYSGCVPNAVPTPCPDPLITSGSCGSGYTGNTVITTTYSGASCTGTPSTDRSGCVPDPTPTPCPDPLVTTGSCGSGYTGNTVITTTYSGATCKGTPSTDRSGCVVIPTVPTCPDPVVSTSACPAPQVGNIISTTSYSGSTCTPKTVVDKTGCSTPTPDPCHVVFAYFDGVDKNNAAMADIYIPLGGQSGSYCTGYTKNWAVYYTCSFAGVATEKNIIRSGCGLFN